MSRNCLQKKQPAKKTRKKLLQALEIAFILPENKKFFQKGKNGESGMPNTNPFTTAQSQLDEAAVRLGLDEATHELLRWPQLELKVTLPVEMDDAGTIGSIYTGG